MAEKSNPILVELTRGARVESTHRGAVAVADADARIAFARGDIDAVIYPRSAFKMLQAVPLVERGAAEAFGLSDEELALACASHSGESAQVALVEAWLKRLGLSAAQLVCGPEGAEHERARLTHNCSGKHAGFLTLALHLGAPVKGYAEPAHPVQHEVRAALAGFCGLADEALAHGRDGCGAPAFIMPLRALAQGLARFVSGKGISPARGAAAQRLSAAMRAHPELIAGAGRPCTELMQAAQGRAIVKAGAEGVYAAALPDRGLGIALKIDDGASRAARAAIAALLAALGAVPADNPHLSSYLDAPVTGADGKILGRVRPAPALRAIMDDFRAQSRDAFDDQRETSREPGRAVPSSR
jgi:L-asparaginase II